MFLFSRIHFVVFFKISDPRKMENGLCLLLPLSRLTGKRFLKSTKLKFTITKMFVTYDVNINTCDVKKQKTILTEAI